jgi:hypothetical protein
LADANGSQVGLEGTFQRLCEEQAAFTLEGDSLPELFNHWLTDPMNERRWLNAAMLFQELKMVAEAEKLAFKYKSPRSLGQRIANTEHNLRTVVGVEIQPDSHLKQKVYRFWKLPEFVQPGSTVTRVSRDSASNPQNATA